MAIINKATAVIGLALAVLIGGTLSIASEATAAELAKFTIIDDNSVDQSLTGKPGDPAKGRKTVYNRKLGNCLTCHVMPIPEQDFHGNIGPDLHGVGDRYTAGELRLRLIDSKVVNPDSIMPSFYRTNFHRVLKGFEGKTVLSAQQIEDVVAYLVTLK